MENRKGNKMIDIDFDKNLFYEMKKKAVKENENVKEHSEFYYLFNPNNKGKLDISDVAFRSYQEDYVMYNEEEGFKREGKELTDGKLRIAGDALNSIRTIFKKYVNDINSNIKFKGGDTGWKELYDENEALLKEQDWFINEPYLKFDGEKIEVSRMSLLFFYLTTTIGNIMPWLVGANINPGRWGLDIVYIKLKKVFEILDWIDFVSKGESEDKKKVFIKKHYLIDFVEDDGITPKEVFNSENAKDKESWDILFFEYAKAILLRGYRVLNQKEGELSECDLKIVKEKYQKLFEKYFGDLEDKEKETFKWG